MLGSGAAAAQEEAATTASATKARIEDASLPVSECRSLTATANKKEYFL